MISHRGPVYARVLRLRHIRPGAIACFLFLEGTVGAAVLLALGDIVDWWAVVVLPVIVAVMVKLNDIVAGSLAGNRQRPTVRKWSPLPPEEAASAEELIGFFHQLADMDDTPARKRRTRRGGRSRRRRTGRRTRTDGTSAVTRGEVAASAVDDPETDDPVTRVPHQTGRGVETPHNAKATNAKTNAKAAGERLRGQRGQTLRDR